MIRSFDHGGNVFSVARELGVAADQILDFSASINPLGMSPVVRTTLISALDSLAHYPDAKHHELKQALAKHHSISPDSITIANGSTALIYNIPAVLDGAKALVISPSFSEYIRALDQHGWEVRHFLLSDEDNFSIDIKKLAGVLTEGFDAMFLCNPGNPGGTLYPLSVIEQIYNLCLATNTFLVLDEAFMDFCEEASAKAMIANNGNAVILRSMTKFYGIPGLRLGYAISCAVLAERLHLADGPWSVNTLALASGVAALEDAKHNARTAEYVTLERCELAKQLSRCPALAVYQSSTNYLLVRIKQGLTAGELRERLLPYRILIRDCSTFTGLTDRFFRVAVRTRQENERLIYCLGKIFQ